jgi:drug/metabolite transporter (DMT)-like permease
VARLTDGRTKAYAGLLLCVALWGMVFPGAARLLAHIDAPQLVTIRFAIVSTVFALCFAARPAMIPRLTRREWLLTLLCGVLAVPGSQLAVVEAQNYLSAPLASLLPTFAPALAAVLAAIFLRERLGSAQAGGFMLALVGVVLILVVGSGTGVSVHASSPLGASIGLITPLSWALYTLVVRSLVGRHSALGTVGLVYIVGTLTLAPAFGTTIGALGRLNTGDWEWLALMATAGTIAPNVLWVVSLRQLPVNRTTAFMYLIPIFASLWTLAVFGRAPEAIALPGGLLVIAGVAITQMDRGPTQPLLPRPMLPFPPTGERQPDP